jgi:PAS domain S-box-containing protein
MASGGEPPMKIKKSFIGFHKNGQRARRNFRLSVVLILIFISTNSFFTTDINAGSNPISVKVGAYANSPKIFMNENARVSGFWPDLIECMAKIENWEIEYIWGTWSEGLGHLINKKIDIMPDVAFTEKRNKRYAFSEDPVLISWTRVYVNKENVEIQSITDLKNKKIATLKGSVNHEGSGGLREIALAFKLDCTFLELNNYTEVFKAIEENRADAGITNRNFGNENAKNFNVKKTPIIFQPINMKFAFPKEGEQTPFLLKKINDCMKKFMQDENSPYYQLLEKYFETEIAEKKVPVLPGWFKIVFQIIGVLFIFFILIIIISRIQVKRKTHEIKIKNEALLKSEKKFRVMFEQAAVGVTLNNSRNGEYVQVNQRYCDITGYSFKEIKQLSFQEITHPDDIQEDLDKMKLLLEGKIREFTLEKRYYRKEGSIAWVRITVSPMWGKGEEPNFHIAFVEDVTMRKYAEKALRKSEKKLSRSKKMEALGLLAGGVAHDLNNVLSGIVSYPDLILMDLPENSKLRKPIETMQESGNRAAAIIQDLLTVARGVAITKEPVNLNDLVSDYLQAPEFNKLEQFHPAVTVTTDLDTNVFNVTGSHVHIRKAVMNLVSNASEAIVGSGSVTISTTNRYIDRPLRGYEDVNIGEYVVLAVSDDGSGISPDDLEKIFEPFYTKKMMGRSGTGLGLAVVWNVVQDHKGYIDVKTGESGTTFELYFPITRDKISDKDLSIPIENYKGNKETILVIDDMENQREISCRMLDRLGYKTQTVSSGEEAVEYLKENSVDLVLLDMIMDPGINGRETYERIIKIHPGQKAVIVSGFADTDEVKQTQKSGAGRYIKKPITLKKIGLAVKEELKK